MAYAPRDLVHNWRLKLSALALSVFLWALVQSEPQNAESFTVPVIVDVADTAWTTSGLPDPTSVELRLTGSPSQIIRLAREGTAVRIPLLEVGSPDTFVTLRRDWVRLGEGSGLAVESMSPSGVTIALEPAVSRVIPVAVNTKGMLPSHLSLASPIGLNPPVVRARGAASRLEGLDSVRLSPLDLSRVEASGVLDLAVDTLGHHGVRFTPATVTVGIRVEEEIERVITGVPVVTAAGDGEAPIVIRPSADRRHAAGSAHTRHRRGSRRPARLDRSRAGAWDRAGGGAARPGPRGRRAGSRCRRGAGGHRHRAPRQ